MFAFLTAIYLILIHGAPLVLMIVPSSLYPRLSVLVATTLLGPPLYTVSFVLLAGLLSLPHQRGIIPGRFPRNTADPVYRSRRLCGLCGTCVYYHKPLYFACLSVPALKFLLFRLFRYRGPLGFTIYPDTWIRDLPLLEIQDGAYLSNRARLNQRRATAADSLTAKHVARLRPEVIAQVKAEAWPQISRWLTVFTDAQIQAIPEREFQSLLVDARGRVPPSRFELLTAWQVHGLRPELVALLPSRILNRLPARKLKAIQVNRLQDETFAELEDKSLSRLSPQQIGMLGEKTALLDGESVNSLSPAQVVALNVPRLSVAAVSGISADRMGMFTPGQIRSMTAEQVGTLHPYQLRKLSSIQLAAGHFHDPSAKDPGWEQARWRP